MIIEQINKKKLFYLNTDISTFFLNKDCTIKFKKIEQIYINLTQL